MQTHQLIQGSPEWEAHRSRYFNASDAPAMLGCSPYETRQQLLQRLATGIVPELDEATQRRFAEGHRIEALARPLAEEIVGDDLAPVVGTEGELSASFDGITFMGDTVFEHKSMNQYLRECMEGDDESGRLPKHYRVQMEQQLMVSGAKRVLFMATRWEGEVWVERRHCWYASDPVLRAEIIAGWRQFAQDLKDYQPPAASAVEKIVAEPVEALPAPVIQVSGQLALKDNFKVFEQRLRQFLENKLIREPKTDQDFADLDGQIKAMKQAREALKAAEAQMLAQVEPVDQAKKTKDMLDALLQQNVSMAEKLLTAEKERRKGEIVAGGVKKFTDHIAALNDRLGKPYMPQVPVDFGGAVKGLKSLASMEDKVATELARAKIAANEVADRIQKNLDYLRGNAKEYAQLFPDTSSIVLKEPDDLQALVKARIAEHKEAEEKRLEAERAKIRQEEEAKARAAAQAELEAKEAEQRRQREAQEAAEARAREATVAPAAPQREESVPLQPAQSEAALTPPAASPQPSPAPAPTVVQMPVRQAAPADDGARMNLSDIKDRLYPIQITAEGLASLGINHVGQEKASKLYRAADFPAICNALIAHITAKRDERAAA